MRHGPHRKQLFCCSVARTTQKTLLPYCLPCMCVGTCLLSRCLAMLWADPSHYLNSRSVHALSQFLLHIFLLPPFDIAWSQVVSAVVILTWVVQWLRLALSERSNRVGVSLLTWGRKEIPFPNHLCSLVFRMLTGFQILLGTISDVVNTLEWIFIWWI
jgi:hypothetical protein